MFDRHIRQWDTYTSKVVAVTKEIERTISPDKVTEMYDAVKEQVQKDMIRAYKIETDQINWIVMEYWDEHCAGQKVIVVKFTLNWKEFIFTKKLHWLDTSGMDDFELAQVFFDFYKEQVALFVIKPILERIKKINS